MYLLIPEFDLWLVASWVIDELEFVGKRRWARMLQRYWRERDITDLVDLLEAAQFPDPMPEGGFGQSAEGSA